MLRDLFSKAAHAVGVAAGNAAYFTKSLATNTEYTLGTTWLGLKKWGEDGAREARYTTSAAVGASIGTLLAPTLIGGVASAFLFVSAGGAFLKHGESILTKQAPPAAQPTPPPPV